MCFTLREFLVMMKKLIYLSALAADGSAVTAETQKKAELKVPSPWPLDSGSLGPPCPRYGGRSTCCPLTALALWISALHLAAASEHRGRVPVEGREDRLRVAHQPREAGRKSHDLQEHRS